jgi:hypothetical protein
MTQQPVAKRRGCFFYGCLTATILLVLALAGFLVGVRYLKKVVTEFTDTAPLTFPAVTLSQSELDALQQRVDKFRDAARKEEATEPLSLSSDEINALIARDPDAKELKGKLYVTLEGDEIKGQISVPTERVGLPMFRGRYLNATGTFNVELRNGLLFLTAKTLTVKGRAVPEAYMEKIRMQNLAADFNNDPRAKAALSKLKEIQVKDGKMIFVPKGAASTTPPP